MVDELILVSYHVVVLDTVELSFEFPDLGAVCVHLLTGTGPVFVELVNNQRGVALHQKTFDAELDCYTETMETCFILRGVVGGREVYPKDIAELVFGRRNEQNACASTVDVKGTVKVHHPVLGASGGNGFLDLGPLSDEISKRL